MSSPQQPDDQRPQSAAQAPQVSAVDLARIEHRPLEEHAEAYQRLHAQLQQALGTVDDA